ncbi:MAG: hypothetical protein K6G15_07440 [Desulfovibrio sp.]|nr:hypothetical protein [Desulfovibrio sp.]
MRKLCCLAVLALCLWAVCAEAGEVKTPANTNAVDILTGELWQKSSPEEKRAFIFGVDTAVTVEYYVNTKYEEKAKKTGKKVKHTLSPFEKGWMKALHEMHRKDLIATIDAWYAEHPESIERPVMAVVWYEIIAPRLSEDKK